MALATMLEDCLLRLSASMGTFASLDAPAKMEVIALSSFAACLLGGDWPAAFNLSIALLALLAVRTRSDAQLCALCGFAIYTSITDFVYLFAEPSSGWGSAMLILNIVLKVGLATNSYALFGTGDDGMPMGGADDVDAVGGRGNNFAGGGGSSSASGAGGGFPSASYIAPAVDSTVDYESMAADAADKHASMGEATRYRPI